MTTAAETLPAKPARKLSAYFWLSFSCLAIAVLGFLPTYWALLANGSLQAHALVHIHAVVFYAWCAFFVFQAWLVSQGKTASHREWGMAGIALATSVVFFGLFIAIRSAAFASAAGYEQQARAFFIVQFTVAPLFGGFVAAAIANVRKPEVHKRLMLAATASMLGAPVARWFMVALAPQVESGVALGPPPVALASLAGAIGLAPMLAALLVEWRQNGKPHPVTLWSLAILVVVLALLAPISETAAWQAIASAFIALAQ